MEGNENIFVLVEKHLSGAMTPDEAAAFQQQLQKDSGFAKEVELHLAARGAIQAASHRHLRTQFDAIYEAEAVKPIPSKGLTLHHYLLSAAAVLILMVGIFWLVKPSASPFDKNQFFAQHFTPETLGTTRGPFGVLEQDSVWGNSLELYQTGRYDEAADIFKSFAQDTAFPYPSAAWYYAGISYLHVRQPQEAFNCLESVTHPLLTEQAAWFGVKALIDQGAIPEAEKRLSAIADDPSHYKQKAAQVLLGEWYHQK